MDSTQRTSFTANLTRSQRIDVDKRVTFRVVVVDACAFALARGWVLKRWQLFSEEGPSKRDYRPATAKSADAQSIVTTTRSSDEARVCTFTSPRALVAFPRRIAVGAPQWAGLLAEERRSPNPQQGQNEMCWGCFTQDGDKDGDSGAKLRITRTS